MLLRSLRNLVTAGAFAQACAAATAAPAAPQAIEPALLDFARQTLLEQAQRDGLIDPQLTVELLPGRQRAPATGSCPGGWQFQALDLRFMSRLRFAAQCAANGASGELALRAQLSAEVLVAAQAVPSGRAIGSEDVQLQRRDISAVPDAVSQVEALAGMSPRSSLRAGQLLQKRQLQAALLVRRGDKVRILARQGGIEVQAAGEALDAGARDALIKVRNVASGRVISARVLDTGLVEPALP